jgi:hypothetical protein
VSAAADATGSVGVVSESRGRLLLACAVLHTMDEIGGACKRDVWARARALVLMDNGPRC